MTPDEKSYLKFQFSLNHASYNVKVFHLTLKVQDDRFVELGAVRLALMVLESVLFELIC